MRRTIAVLAGLVLLAGLAMLPSTAGAQSPPPTVAPTSAVPTTEAPTTTMGPTTIKPTEETVAPNVVVKPQPGKPAPQVQGDVVSRPLPRTGNEIGGTALFGGALTVLGVALALGARKRRNSFDGA